MPDHTQSAQDDALARRIEHISNKGLPSSSSVSGHVNSLRCSAQTFQSAMIGGSPHHHDRTRDPSSLNILVTRFPGPARLDAHVVPPDGMAGVTMPPFDSEDVVSGGVEEASSCCAETYRYLFFASEQVPVRPRLWTGCSARV